MGATEERNVIDITLSDPFLPPAADIHRRLLPSFIDCAILNVLNNSETVRYEQNKEHNKKGSIGDGIRIGGRTDYSSFHCAGRSEPLFYERYGKPPHQAARRGQLPRADRQSHERHPECVARGLLPHEQRNGCPPEVLLLQQRIFGGLDFG